MADTSITVTTLKHQELALQHKLIDTCALCYTDTPNTVMENVSHEL